MESRMKQFLHRLFGQEKEAAETKAAEAAAPSEKAAEPAKAAPAPEKKPAGTASEEVVQEPMPKHGYGMGDGYIMAYNQVPNGYGGYHEVDMRLYHNGKLIRKITDERGVFLDFPGVVHGYWEHEVNGKFVPQVNFVTSIYPFKEDGLATFRWMVQPDGRYWADDDGFGMENDVEINLSAKMDKEGRFVTPFSKV